jgi:hypothetical protein
MSAFAQAVRECAFTSRDSQHLAEGTVSTTISYVAQAFRSNNQEDPRLDRDGKTCFMLQEQLKGYKNQDSSTKKQKALPLVVLRKMMHLSSSEKEKAISWLLIGATFFAMRSCEYLQTSVNENKKRTKILRLRNFRFKKNDKVLCHSSPELTTADMVIITFEFQKNKMRNKSVHMYKTDDEILNPVLAWASTIQRILQTVPDASNDTIICAFRDRDSTIYFDSNSIRPRLRAVVHLIGEAILGFGKEDVGLHSIRAGGAMAMFLSGVNEIIIQRIGRWQSLAFLEYIREQVDSFTFGVSQKMLQHEKFHHLNEQEEKLLENEEEDKHTSKEDGHSSHIPFTIHYSDGVLKKHVL